MERKRYSPRRIVLAVVVTVVVLAGVWAIWSALGKIWIPVAIVVFGVIATIPGLARGALLLACAVVVAMLALIGFNVFLGLIMGWLPDGFVKWLPDWIADGRGRLEIRFGLALAVVVFAGAAYFYLRGTWLRAVPTNWRAPRLLRWIKIPTPGWPKWLALTASVVLAVGVILGLPRALTEVEEQLEDPPAALPVPARLDADVDVLIVADRRHAQVSELPAGRARGGFVTAYSAAVDLDARYSLGLAEGRNLVWTHTGIADAAKARTAMAKAPEPGAAVPDRRPQAAGAIVLMVDGTPPVVEEPEKLEDVAGRPGEIDRWAAIARKARSGAWESTPVYALLQTTDEGRLADWSKTFDELGGVISIQGFGSQTATDAAVRLAVGNSDVEADFWLAMRYRPILLFDSGEPVPRPLSIERLFVRRLVRQCSSLESEGVCGTDLVVQAGDLRTPGTHLVISRPPENLRNLAQRESKAWESGRTTLESPPKGVPAALTADLGAPPPGTPPAAASQPGEPVPDADLFLGQGSRIYVHPVAFRQGPRQLLFLDYWWYLHDNPAASAKGAFCGAGLVIVGVTCFDHESDWEGITVVLERKAEWQPLAVYYAEHEAGVRYEWNDLRTHWDGAGGLDQRMRDRLSDYADRPLAFIARGTHATYGRRCRGECRQVATDLEEGNHNGGLSWVGNDTEACLRVACLIPLPSAAGGGGPASWNAFEGPWGRRHCVWTYYCDSGTPPAAPGQQGRYKDPKRFDGRAQIEKADSYEAED